MVQLKDKTAVVVGGGTGIGLGIARALAAAGCRTLIGGRREEVLREAVAGSEPEILCRTIDVADRQNVLDFMAWATEQLGRIDILVNSAGVNIKTRTMAEMTPEQWDQVMQINATGAYNCMYAVLPQMRERRDGLIINISSISGLRASALGGVAYSAAKFAMAALGTAVANEVGPSGIRVTNIYPGEVNTPILEHRPQPVTAERKATMMLPEDFGELVVAIANLHPRAHVSDLVIKPTVQDFT